jgi:hypothetical protein
METDQFPFGIDVAKDVINTGKRTGVIQGSTWLYHDSFPGGKLNGKPAVAKFIADNPQVIPRIRDEVMQVMEERKIQAKAAKRPNLAVVNE